QPTMGEVAIHLVPHLSNGWLDEQPAQRYATGGYLIESRRIETKVPHPLTEATLAIEGLQNTITDVFVRIQLLNGQNFEAIARPERPSIRIALADGNSLGMAAFVKLGIEHILSGPDHLAFVFGLLLIVTDRFTLLKTVSAFTLAHSLTLATVAVGS